LTPEERANSLAESLARFEWDKLENLAEEARSVLQYYAVRQGRMVAEPVSAAS
jgi:hypothetical protein